MKSSLGTIEPLESRLAPAGMVDVLVRNGALFMETLADGDSAESLRITHGPSGGDTYVLEANGGTRLRVNGIELLPDEDFTISGITRSITIALGAGPDYLSLAGAHLGVPVKINLGDGENVFTTSGAITPALTYQSGAGPDFINFANTLVAGSAKFDLGGGDNFFTLGGGTVGGDLLIRAAEGADELFSGGTTQQISGKFTVMLGDGHNEMVFDRAFQAGRNVNFVTGRGNDFIAFNAASDFVFGGNFTVQTGSGSDNVLLKTQGAFQVAKNFSIFSAGQVPTGGVQHRVEAALELSVGGNVLFQCGPAAGAGQQLLSPARDIAIGGSVTFRSAAAESLQVLDAAQSLTIGRGLSLSMGLGMQIVSSTATNGFGLSAINGPVSLRGASEVHLELNGDIRGPVTIATGRFAEGAGVLIGEANAAATLRIHGPLRVQLASQAFGAPHSVSFHHTTLHGPATLQGGVGADQFYFFETQTFGAVTISGGAGEDELLVEKASPMMGRSSFWQNFTFRGGTGNDSVTWAGAAGGADVVFAAAKVVLDGGAGADTFNVGNGAIFLVPVVSSEPLK